MLDGTSLSLQHWKGSSPGRGMPQEIEQYEHTFVNTFMLKSIPCLETIASNATEAAFLKNLIDAQKTLLKSIAQWNYVHSDRMNGDIVYGYSLRFLYMPSQNQKDNVKIYLVSRVSSNNKDVARRARKSQADYLNSILDTQSYKFELDEKYDWNQSWLNEQPSVSCCEIVKQEEVFLLDIENRWYFYAPGILKVNETNTMIDLLQQLQSYDRDVCIDITLVPIAIQDTEKTFLSRYIETLTRVSRAKRDDITPDSNAELAKSAYEELRRHYFSNPVFLCSFRVFSPCQYTCQNIANQVANCCTNHDAHPLVTFVPDENYAVQTVLQVNINHQAGNLEIWDKMHNTRLDFKPPNMLKRLHRIVGIDEASVFFRLPIPVDRCCPSLEYALPSVQDEKNGFPVKLEIRDILEKYDSLITEDTYVVGIDQSGNPCISDFSKVPHRIVAGTPGSGKTNFLASVIYQFLYASAKISATRNIYIADFKAGFDYLRIQRHYKDVKVVTKAEDLSILLHELYQEYERRLEKMMDEDVETLKELRQKCRTQEHRILLFIDEAATLLTAERKVREEIDKYLRELAAKGRIVEIHIFYCSQRPTLDVIPRIISDNMDERVIFRASSSASQHLIGDDMAAELPVDPKGRAVYRGSEPMLEVVATPYVPKTVWGQSFT